MKKTIHLNESTLRQIVTEAVKNIMTEHISGMGKDDYAEEIPIDNITLYNDGTENVEDDPFPFDIQDDRNTLWAIIKQVLDPIEYMVIRAFFYDDMTLEDIALILRNNHNIRATRERARQIKEKAVRKLRNNPTLQKVLRREFGNYDEHSKDKAYGAMVRNWDSSMLRRNLLREMYAQPIKVYFITYMVIARQIMQQGFKSLELYEGAEFGKGVYTTNKPLDGQGGDAIIECLLMNPDDYQDFNSTREAKIAINHGYKGDFAAPYIGNATLYVTRDPNNVKPVRIIKK